MGLDISTAFDRIRWDFVISVLKKLDFPENWINLISQCISTVQYSVLINGRTTKVFRLCYGLTQGDPLSPILFSICIEALSTSLTLNMGNGNIKAVSIAKNSPPLSHLLFADDNFFFLHLNSKSLNSFSSILSDYYTDSG
ncbi:hypothetical protein LIER_16943 [Lithospermum erythrorhizon]|uniref:Reverse transcriptase domain-containing protein n=1 Tax=Lithospermum erythrorhizon TaxID=34254 RepID=A0AAV3Q999_LITER